MVHASVLVLNRSYMPIHVTTARRAFSLLYQGLARAIDKHYQTFDFESWSELAIEAHDQTIGLVDRIVKIPKVIVLIAFDRMPRRHVRFSRHNIYARDNNTCQYCGVQFPRSELNLDHVVPRSLGGTSTWENIVCSCLSCNRRKGGMTPQEAGLRLLRHPRRPKWTPMMGLLVTEIRHREWLPFLNIVDASYWNAELRED
jgi:5-methylcytosine-specific restriction endonuclease McrA